MQTPSTPPKPSAPALATLLLSAAANAALAVYQWHELLGIRSGGTAACSINETVNCATVWNLPFASRMHEWFGMPVAGLGLVWALTALVLAALVAWRSRSGRDVSVAIGAIRLTAIAGVFACVIFGVVSISGKAVCLTCLGTYGLVAAYALAAFVLLPQPSFSTDKLPASAAWAVVVAVPVFLAMLAPGARTPKAPQSKIAATTESSDTDLIAYLQSMPPPERQAVADVRQIWLSASKPELGNVEPRALLGPPTAPVAVVDFTDILCGHCKQLEQILTELRRVLPAGRLSIEARHFPLDGECNPRIQKVWGDGIRCLAAKAQICLEGSPALWPVKHELFERQDSLSKELIVDLAVAQSGMSKEALLGCVAAPQTQAKLEADIEYAVKYNITGTPLVLVNGKSVPPSGSFLLAMAIFNGDANAPYFATLPPPNPAAAEHE